MQIPAAVIQKSSDPYGAESYEPIQGSFLYKNLIKGVGGTRIHFLPEDLKPMLKFGSTLVNKTKEDLVTEYIMVEGLNLRGDMECTAVACNGCAMGVYKINGFIMEEQDSRDERFRLMLSPFKLPKDAVMVEIEERENDVKVRFLKEFDYEIVYLPKKDGTYFPDWRKVWPKYDLSNVTYKIRMDPKLMLKAMEAMKDEEFVELCFGNPFEPMTCMSTFSPKRLMVLPMRA